MQKILLITLGIFICNLASAQKTDAYIDTIKLYQKNYINTHDVIKKKQDLKYFRFFPISSKYNVFCKFEKINDTSGFTMKTSANTLQHYFKYGRLNFVLDGKDYHLYVYQSSDLMKTEKYKDYLFVPFTDASTGDESYGSGRYLDFSTTDIKNNTLYLDFNKAYNPSCAYATGFHCPIPPKENLLTVAINAGEKNFGKGH